MKPFNPNSPSDISLLFFGGMIKEEQTVQEGFFKNGNPRIRKQTVLRPICGLGLKPQSDWETKKNGVYSVDEEVLNIIAKLNPVRAFIKGCTLTRTYEIHPKGDYWFDEKTKMILGKVNEQDL